MIAVESLLFLLGGIILAVILIQVFGRWPEAGRGRALPLVRLVRQTPPADGHEETRLLINEQAIVTASSQGLRLADYAAEVEQIEAMATRIASALGVNVELARIGLKSAELEEGVPVRQLPRGEREERKTG
jgi:hypothetical protein